MIESSDKLNHTAAPRVLRGTLWAAGLCTVLSLAGCNSNSSSGPQSPSSIPSSMPPSGMPPSGMPPSGMPGSKSPSTPGSSPSSMPGSSSPSMPGGKSMPSGQSGSQGGSSGQTGQVPPPPGGTSGGGSGGSSGSYEPLPGASPPGGSGDSGDDAGRMPGDSGSGQSGEGQGGSGGTNQPSWNPGSGAGTGQEPGTGTLPGQQGAGGGGGREEESWEEGLPGGSGEDGWETSNQVPTGGNAEIPPMPSERDKPAGSGDGELDGALEDFDGEILAEREVIRSRSNETAGRVGGSNLPQSGAGSAGREGDESAGGGTADLPQGPGGSGFPSERNSPPAPRPVAAASIPDDIPDATDDDIIARQLREAAMQETDPELKEKLWDEYRRYKGI